MTKTSVATKRRPPAASRLKTVAEPAVKAKTLRLAPEYEAGLTLLKGVLGMPVNKMVNEAVGEYIVRRTAKVEIGRAHV